MVADYLLRGFLALLAVVGVASEVRAQSPIRVGYYDMTNGNGAGIPEQVPPIVAAGFTPVLLDNVTATDLAGLHILFVVNPNPNIYGTEYLASRPAITAAVNAGMVLIIHDRTVTFPATNSRVGDILPGVVTPASILASKGTAATNNAIELSTATGLIVNGPFGAITSTSLDGGILSNHGHVNLVNPFFTTRSVAPLLHTGTSAQIQSQSVTFSYAFGLGYVIYSTIPLDMFLKGGGMQTPPAVTDAFKNIYAPNVLTYAACGLKAFPATVNVGSATGYYGGTTTLTATVKCGVIPVVNGNVAFTLNGVAVGSAQTNAEGIATLANAKLGSLPASPATTFPVGSYPAGVVASFDGTGLYGASQGTAPLTVGKAPATLSFAGGNFVYDAAPHAATGTVTGVFGESLGVPAVTYTDELGVTSDIAPVNAGTYRITASVAESGNYLGTSAESGPKIKITPAPLVIAAQDKTKPYGAALPPLTATYSGFVGGEGTSVLGGTLQLTTEATAASRVDDYRITPSGLTSNNYDIEFVDGILKVTPAALTVRAAAAEKVYGAMLPEFTVVYEGFVLGETAASLDGSLEFDTDATASSAVGVYQVTPKGLHSRNYTIAFVPGVLAIVRAALTVRADDTSKLYGAPLPTFTARFEGFVLGDTPATLGGSLAFTTAATVASDVGRYRVTPSGLTSPDYSITFSDGYLTVSPEGRMHGNGVVEAADAKHHFDFAVSDTIRLGEKGSLKLEIERKRGSDDRFVSLLVSEVIFEDLRGVNPGGKAEADTVTIVGVGRWNGLPATFEASATDNGEPGGRSDSISIRIFVGGKLVNATSGLLKSGNIQSNRLPRRK